MVRETKHSKKDENICCHVRFIKSVYLTWRSLPAFLEDFEPRRTNLCKKWTPSHIKYRQTSMTNQIMDTHTHATHPSHKYIHANNQQSKHNRLVNICRSIFAREWMATLCTFGTIHANSMTFPQPNRNSEKRIFKQKLLSFLYKSLDFDYSFSSLCCRFNEVTGSFSECHIH